MTVAQRRSGPKGDGLTVGERLRQVRGDRSQVEFAELLGISSKTLIRYESGERVPDAELLVKLNVLHNVQPLWLLTGAYEPLPSGLDKNEKRVLDAFRVLDEHTRKAVLTVFTRMAAVGETPTADSTPIDENVLTACIAVIEEHPRGRTLPPKKKAQAVLALYTLMTHEPAPSKTQLENAIQRAA